MARRGTTEFLRQIRAFVLRSIPVGHTRFLPVLAPRTQALQCCSATRKFTNNYLILQNPIAIFGFLRKIFGTKKQLSVKLPLLTKEAPKKGLPKEEPSKDIFFPSTKEFYKIDTNRKTSTSARKSISK